MGKQRVSAHCNLAPELLLQVHRQRFNPNMSSPGKTWQKGQGPCRYKADHHADIKDNQSSKIIWTSTSNMTRLIAIKQISIIDITKPFQKSVLHELSLSLSQCLDYTEKFFLIFRFSNIKIKFWFLHFNCVNSHTQMLQSNWNLIVTFYLNIGIWGLTWT